MKRAAIICLILMLGICLVTGANADPRKAKYMMLYIDVETGDLVEVFGTDVVPATDEEMTNAKIKKEARLPHQDNNGNNTYIIRNVRSEKSYQTIFATSSPGCRYILYNGVYYKICY